MAKANAKKRAEENKARMTLLFRVLVGAIATFAIVRLGVYRSTSKWWFHYPLFASTAGRVGTPGGCQIGYMDLPRYRLSSTGVLVVVTPGVRLVDWTGCRHWCFHLQNNVVKSANPTCGRGMVLLHVLSFHRGPVV
jgi:hypothetical protein